MNMAENMRKYSSSSSCIVVFVLLKINFQKPFQEKERQRAKTFFSGFCWRHHNGHTFHAVTRAC